MDAVASFRLDRRSRMGHQRDAHRRGALTMAMHIVLTGSSSGIGRGIAERLTRGGHRVWGLARSDQSMLADEMHGRFLPHRCDVSRWSEVEETRRAVARQTGYIDALITCAGTQGEIGRATEVDPLAWSGTVQANIDGTYFPIRAFRPMLSAAAGRPKIVCFSGGGATKARPHFSAYAAAKTAIVRLVETISAEEQALDINAVAPGAIATRMTDEVIALGPEKAGADEYAAAVKHRAAASGTLERALDLVEWLLSPASDGISGRLISAPWDPWRTLDAHRNELDASDIYRLRRIVPEDRGPRWS